MMNKKRSGLGLITMICIAVAVIVIGISFSSRLSAKSKIVIAKKNIKMGTVVNENNINMLFEIGEKNDDCKEGYFTYLEDLYGVIIINDLEKGKTLTEKMIADNYKPVTDIKEPVVMGLRAVDISQFVSGTLRRGDTVNLSFVDEYTGKCNRLMENVFVCDAFNDDGSSIEDENGRAMSINVLVEKEDEQVINEYLHKGQLRISKTGSGLND